MSSSKPSGSKTKRKIADEHRNFQEKWELDVPKLYNIKRHYEQHISKYDTYEGLMRQEKLKEFKLGMKKQQFMFTKVSQESEAAVHASYVLSAMIAKHSKPFTEGDFIKECLIKAAEIVCPGSVKTFQAISLSRNTVVERVTDMARNLNDQIKKKSSCFEAFSIACDESTDIGGVAQLAVFFFRACDTDFNIYEELLELVPMHGTTTGEYIFNCVHDLLQKYNLPQSKLTSIATDGAPSMTGKTNGFVALLRKKLSEISDGSNIHHTHCIIHQGVICTKVSEFTASGCPATPSLANLSASSFPGTPTCDGTSVATIYKYHLGLEVELAKYPFLINQEKLTTDAFRAVGPHLFTKCLRFGHFPSPWKIGLLVLIPKPDSTTENPLERFRPIALLNTLAKVFERCILAQYNG
ncbi:hypothetical protein LAZ67_X002673 [Cordylochernes scorpioides]|uniref:Reverse transcriptase domain-containing protein n=1 Tax=Cordylochernes scorpioides TaxID=51811 RepID=A0ABY6LU15_9ARAC|nr:hypothetical protein LAZ67_X002673 [Cordylochernes scorpioides]